MSYVKGSVIQFLLSQVRTSTGSLIGGKVYFYNPGTTSTTGIEIWLDEEATSAANNPYTLDANATAQLYASGKYRIVIKDAAGVTRFDRDDIMFYDFDVPYEYDALQYGAGTFTQATIEAALTAIGTVNKVTLLLRPGAWPISTPLAIPANVTVDMPPGSYFTFSGTGAVTGLKYATPQMMGAKGDGTTDDTVAFQKLGSSISTGGKIEIPDTGSFYVMTNFTCPYSNITFINNGYLKMKAHADVIFDSPFPLGMLAFGDQTEATGTSNITVINNGTIDGNHGTLSEGMTYIEGTLQNNWSIQYGLIAIYSGDGYSIQNYGTIKDSFQSGIILAGTLASSANGIVQPIGRITGCVNDAIAHLYTSGSTGKTVVRDGYIKGASLMRGPLMNYNWTEGLVENIEFVESYGIAVGMGYAPSAVANNSVLRNIKFTDCVKSVYVNPNWPGSSVAGFPVLLIKGDLANNENIHDLTFSQSALKTYPPFGIAIGGGTGGAQSAGRYKNITFTGAGFWRDQIIVNTDGHFDSISDINACDVASGNNLNLSLSTGGGIVERVMIAMNSKGNAITPGIGMKISNSNITTTGALHNSIYVGSTITGVEINDSTLTSGENGIQVDGKIRSIRGNTFSGGEGVHLAASGVTSPNLGTGAVIRDNYGAGLSVRRVLNVAGCAAGTTAGKAKTVNAIKLQNGVYFESLAATDNYWDLTGVTTGAAEYMKVALCKYQGGGAYIVKGDVATSQAAAIPPTVNPYLAVIGIVEIPNSYAGGALGGVFYDMIGEQ